jgi:hypothetical protein
MNIAIYLFLYFGQVIVTFPEFWNTCGRLNFETFLLYFAHHALDVFLFWSWFFLVTRREYIAHLIALLIVSIHWVTNNNNCIATEYMNKLCGYKQDQWLSSFKNMFGLREYTEYFLFIWLGILGIRDIYYIF